MKSKMLIFLLFICISNLCFKINSFAQPASVATGTPEIYKVTMKKFEISQDGTIWVTVADTEMTFDIASVSAGSKVADWTSNAVIPNGTYTRVRPTVSSTFRMKGYAYYGTTNRTYFTTPSGISSVAGNVTDISLMTNYGEQDITVPEGGSCTGGQCVNTENQTFVVQANQTSRKRVRFDVTNRLGLYNAGGGNYVFYPEQPVVDTIDVP